MLKRIAGIIFSILVPMIAFAAPASKQGSQPMQIDVVSIKKGIHGASPNVFTYTAVIYGRVDGKNVMFVCAENKDACPYMEAGKMYVASRTGSLVYIPVTPVDTKKPVMVRYRQTGSW
jgi:hypothetical protein